MVWECQWDLAIRIITPIGAITILSFMTHGTIRGIAIAIRGGTTTGGMEATGADTDMDICMASGTAIIMVATMITRTTVKCPATIYMVIGHLLEAVLLFPKVHPEAAGLIKSKEPV
jgi:hypothetical protein